MGRKEGSTAREEPAAPCGRLAKGRAAGQPGQRFVRTWHHASQRCLLARPPACMPACLRVAVGERLPEKATEMGSSGAASQEGPGEMQDGHQMAQD